jgi:hypothetical protein
MGDLPARALQLRPQGRKTRRLFLGVSDVLPDDAAVAPSVDKGAMVNVPRTGIPAPPDGPRMLPALAADGPLWNVAERVDRRRPRVLALIADCGGGSEPALGVVVSRIRPGGHVTSAQNAVRVLVGNLVAHTGGAYCLGSVIVSRRVSPPFPGSRVVPVLLSGSPRWPTLPPSRARPQWSSAHWSAVKPRPHAIPGQPSRIREAPRWTYGIMST